MMNYDDGRVERKKRRDDKNKKDFFRRVLMIVLFASISLGILMEIILSHSRLVQHIIKN